MKILHLISSGGMYGAEAVILDLSRGLRQSGHASLLGVFGNSPDEETEFKRRARETELETHTVLCRKQLETSVPGQIRALVRSTGADVVHAHGYKADVYAFLALRGSKIPLVSTCHTWYDNDLALRVYGFLDRLVLRRFAAVIAVSREVKASLLGAGVAAERVHIIRNGISAAGYDGPPRTFATSVEAPAIGLVGRLAPEKGVDIYLRAAALVHEHLPRARFRVAGDGPDRGMLEALLEELRLKDYVQLLGRQENMAAFFASLDLLVSASRQEGLPIALLEGMASGLPVVATRVGEVTEVVQPDVTGLLVEPEDPGALASAILSILSDPDRLAAMGTSARKRVLEQFSADRMTADYTAIYQSVMDSTRAGDR